MLDAIAYLVALINMYPAIQAVLGALVVLGGFGYLVKRLLASSYIE